MSKESVITSADKEIENYIKEYQNDVGKNEYYHRYLSWEFCYNEFGKTREKIDDYTLDYLALHVAVYLSSWGMYRGSSFLLQKNYKIHIPIVNIVLKDEYRSLRGISANALLDQKHLVLLKKVSDEITNHYIAVEPSEGKKSNNVTDTLITKILLGTLGCVPAFDVNVVNASRKSDDLSGNYNTNAIKKMAQFFIKNETEFKRVREDLQLFTYPDMKLLDMYLWKKGEKQK